MGKLGLFGLPVPEEYGGSGGDFTSLCVAIEEIGRVDQSLGITLEAAVGLGISPILACGTPEQKQRWLPDLAAGQALAGFGLTEAGVGVGRRRDTKTRAVLSDDGTQWVINGSKQFITNSGTPITSLVTVTARTGENADGKPEISAIIVPAGTPGFVVEPAYRKLGWHASDTHPLTFDDCRVPAAQPARASAARASAVPRHRSTTAGSRSPRWRSAASRKAAWTRRWSTPVSARRSAGRSARKQGVAFQIADLQVDGRGRPSCSIYKAAALKDAGRPAAEFKQAAASREAVRHRGRGDRRPDRHPGVRRLRLHGGVPGRPLLPGRQDPGDRRGYERDPAAA